MSAVMSSESVIRRYEWSLDTPAVGRDVSDALLFAWGRYEEVTGDKPADDSITVELEDDRMLFWFAVKETGR